MNKQEQIETRIRKNNEKIKLLKLNKDDILTIYHLENEIISLKLILDRLKRCRKKELLESEKKK